MTASVLKQDPSTQNVQKKAVYQDKIKHVNFRGNPPLSSYKTTLKQQLNGEKRFFFFLDGQLNHLSVLLVVNLLAKWTPIRYLG